MNDSIIETRIFRSNKDFLDARRRRIDEALSFQGGSRENPKKHVISTLPNGKEAYYKKPGKEAFQKAPNIHDMSVWVGKNDANEFESYTFEDIWAYLVECSMNNQSLLKKILTLLYRLCYFLDHLPDTHGNLRYSPSKKMRDYIDKIDLDVQRGFKDKFKKKGEGILEYLHFIDLLAWNEDVKYYTKNDGNFSMKDKNVGRPNTIISVISMPLMINDFMSNIIENAKDVGKINVRLILTAMQQLSKSRGVCVLSHEKLRQYLSPHLIPNK